MVVCCRRFGTAYWSHFTVRLSRNVCSKLPFYTA